MWALELSASLALASSCVFSLGAIAASRRADAGRPRLALFCAGVILGALLGSLSAIGMLRELRSFWLLAPMLAAAGLGIGALLASAPVLTERRRAP